MKRGKHERGGEGAFEGGTSHSVGALLKLPGRATPR